MSLRTRASYVLMQAILTQRSAKKRKRRCLEYSQDSSLGVCVSRLAQVHSTIFAEEIYCNRGNFVPPLRLQNRDFEDSASESASRTVSRVRGESPAKITRERERNRERGREREGGREERSVFLGGRRKRRAAVTGRRINNR